MAMGAPPHHVRRTRSTTRLPLQAPRTLSARHVPCHQSGASRNRCTRLMDIPRPTRSRYLHRRCHDSRIRPSPRSRLSMGAMRSQSQHPNPTHLNARHRPCPHLPYYHLPPLVGLGRRQLQGWPRRRDDKIPSVVWKRVSTRLGTSSPLPRSGDDEEVSNPRFTSVLFALSFPSPLLTSPGTSFTTAPHTESPN